MLNLQGCSLTITPEEVTLVARTKNKSCSRPGFQQTIIIYQHEHWAPCGVPNEGVIKIQNAVRFRSQLIKKVQKATHEKVSKTFLDLASSDGLRKGQRHQNLSVCSFLVLNQPPMSAGFDSTLDV